MNVRKTLARAVALALLAAPTAVALAAAAPSEAAAPLGTTVTIQIGTSAPIERGDTTSISGSVKDSTGASVNYGTVTLQASPYPFTTWTTVATDDASGYFYFGDVTPSITTHYQVVYGGYTSTSSYPSSYSPSAPSNVVAQGVARVLSIHHHGLHMRGNVSPAKKKLKIVFKLIKHRKLHKWFSVKTNKKGKFSKHIKGKVGTRFVVLVPNSRTLGISKRLPDAERKRLRGILDKCRPEGHGVIVRTAAEGITGPEIERDLQRLVDQWTKIDALARKVSAPALLYREPDMALRVIREEFSRDYRKIIIDDQAIFEDVRDYVGSVSPALTERVEHYDAATEPLPIFEKHHIIEQLHRALDRKVWLPSGGSLIIEHTEALTVIDVNTGKNVGTSNLEDTVFSNNLEAAEEIARQLRLRDVGGIIVIDFIDMEIKANRAKVIKVFRDALARDKTRTQVFDISELGLVQMTRKRIGEGLLESFTSRCEVCEGRGVVFDQGLLE